MRKTVYIRILFLPILLSAWSGFTQQRILKIANKMFEQRRYVSAQEAYMKLIDRDFKNAVVLRNLGDSYYFNGQLEDAEKWLKEFIESYPNQIDPEYLFKYSQSLKSIRDYANSDYYMDNLLRTRPIDQRANLFDKQRDYLERIDYQSGRYQIKNLPINSSFTDFGTAFYVDDAIVFSSSRDTLLFNKRVHKWTEESFLELYQSEYNSETESYSSPKLFSKELANRFHESSPVFTDNGNTVYFTQNQSQNGKNEIIRLKILRSFKNDDGSWGIPLELPFNSRDYSTSHPAISSDGKTLYFSSDMPGGYGMSDIYALSINGDGSFGNPMNLGSGINTEARETFAYSVNDTLYFSSNGHPGLGGLDVFVATLDSNSNFKVINIGEPINSTSDDFGFIINDKDKGFFSSNRKGGVGGDDIYSLQQLYPIRSFDLTTVLGTITDNETFDVVNDAIVTIYDQENNVIDKQASFDKGNYHFDANEKIKDSYRITVTKKGYKSYEHVIDKKGFMDLYEKSIILEKEEKKQEEEIVVNKDAFNFELIVHPKHFRDNSTDILDKSKQKLNKIIALMKQYPRVTSSIKSYVDKEEKTAFTSNLQAQAIKQYFLDRGIPEERLSAQGYPKNRIKNEEKLRLVMVVPTPAYFSFNSEEIRPEVEISLAKVVDLMTIYPKMKMEIHSHADSRSSFWYNKELSVRRMRATESYLTKKGGIYWRRLRGRAYGERRLYNDCSDGVPCLEEQHQQNRRSEFVILE